MTPSIRRLCSIPSCVNSNYGNSYCNKHWQQSKKGAPCGERDQEKLSAPVSCRMCGEDHTGESGLRAFCSRNCYHRFRRNGNRPVEQKACVDCGSDIDYFAETGTGRMRKRSSLRCGNCDKQWSHKSGWCMTKAQLAERDGWVCGIGGEFLDPNIKFPDPRGATIDHIIPRSVGGQDIPENLQLACWKHNRAKSNNLNYQAETAGVQG